MKFAIACGGTGGHLFPGLAVAEVLRGRGHEVLLLISEKQIDAIAVRDRTDFEVRKIASIGMPSIWSLQIFPFAAKFASGFLTCWNLFRSWQPSAVLGMGGFTSTAPILAGRLLKTPTFIHESNAIPGKANRINAKLADTVLLGFEECGKYFPAKPTQVTGTPIRTSLRGTVDRETAQQNLRLKPGLQTVAVFGGSQGAHGINEAVVASLHQFATKPVQFIHLTGREDLEFVYDRYRQEGIPAFVAAFHYQMEDVYGAADLIIARSGAASLSEISYFGLPTILIPYPFATDNHQSLNAAIYSRNNAAVVLEGADANGENLGNLIDALLSDPKRRRMMGERMQALAITDAASKIAELL
ncbi:MAG TPA: undecaprenyldiphospho-muramoylpentapeptide beta-N-acetylglucosaminyltransferase, partial [Chthoniobacterales bacterium]|nr:undecaprenyldiphospho-muramoylpentapeptide beta-N-acetylglucosaminyltransferase [Chthoniobacterales bacterium]